MKNADVKEMIRHWDGRSEFVLRWPDVDYSPTSSPGAIPPSWLSRLPPIEVVTKPDSGSHSSR